MLLEDHVQRLGHSGVAVLIVEQKALAALAISDWAYVMAAGSMKVSSNIKRARGQDLIEKCFWGEARGGRQSEPRHREKEG